MARKQLNIYYYTFNEADLEYSPSKTYEIHQITWYSILGGPKFFYYNSIDDTPLSAPAPDHDVWYGVTVDPVDVTTNIPDFRWIPAYTNQVPQKPNTLSVQFGDGYRSVINRTINPNLLTLNLKFDNRSTDETAAIVHFLDQRKGSEAFGFTPPPPFGHKKKFICPQWDVTDNFFDHHTVSARFEEVPV